MKQLGELAIAAIGCLLVGPVAIAAMVASGRDKRNRDRQQRTHHGVAWLIGIALAIGAGYTYGTAHGWW